MSPFEAYERIVGAFGSPAHARRVAEMRRAFEARTGPFRPDDAWFEARSRAFWDDAVTSVDFGHVVESDLPEPARAWVAPFARAHRGLFARLEEETAEARAAHGDAVVVLRDVLGHAEFVIDRADGGMLDALASAGGLFDARLVGCASPAGVAVLPGALFHPEDATDAILEVLASAAAKDLAAPQLLDALMRMEHRLRSLSRVKAAYAYRADALY